MKDNDSVCWLYNGARCKSYCWSQGHSDLEVRVLLDRACSNNDIRVSLTYRYLKIELIYSEFTPCKTVKVLLEGTLERSVVKDSLFWHIDDQPKVLVLFMDKLESLWWNSLIVGEQAIERGITQRSIPSDSLDEGARMVINKLIAEQKEKKGHV